MTPATTHHEIPVFLPAGGEELFGVVTRPVGEPAGTAVIIAAAGGFYTSVHVNRLAVEMARRVAGRGYHAMRLDYHGLGESSGSVGLYRMDQPFAEDVDGAVRWFRDQGIERFVLVGSCFGGRAVLEVASRIEGVEGIVMISTPLVDMRQGEGTPARKIVDTSVWRYAARGFRRDVLRRFFPPHSFRRQVRVAWAHLRLGARVGWRRLRGKLAGERSEGLEVNPKAVADIEHLVRRRVPLLLIYGDEDPFLRPIRPGGSRRIEELLAEAGPLAEVRTMRGERAYRYVEGQTGIVDVLDEWLARRPAQVPAAHG
jgi:pimeloyl-ACP methyl ester carboxylesterase